MAVREKVKNSDPSYIGRTYGLLVVISMAGRDVNKNALAVVRCVCGIEKTTPVSALKVGRTTSCGKCSKRNKIKHGHARQEYKTREWKIWAGMRKRCENPRCPGFKDYGGRGISICERWNEYKFFLEDMGPCPLGFTLERKDNEKGYSKENCKWATPKEQARNRRNTHLIEINGVRKSVAEWAEESGLSRSTIIQRERKGLAMDKLLSPARKAQAA